MHGFDIIKHRVGCAVACWGHATYTLCMDLTLQSMGLDVQLHVGGMP